MMRHAIGTPPARLAHTHSYLLTCDRKCQLSNFKSRPCIQKLPLSGADNLLLHNLFRYCQWDMSIQVKAEALKLESKFYKYIRKRKINHVTLSVLSYLLRYSLHTFVRRLYTF